MNINAFFNIALFYFVFISYACSDNYLHSQNVQEEFRINRSQEKVSINGSVSITEFCPSIKVELAYATTSNFLGIRLYQNPPDMCLVPKRTAEMLCRAQHFLDSVSGNYSLYVFDCARPLHIQQKMWDSLKLPIEQKIKYLAYPGNRSMHNYGAAVDIGLIKKNGTLVSMGTPFDSFTSEAHITNESYLLSSGKISSEELWHRLLLRNAMLSAGFKTMSTEWWHFDACSKSEVDSLYQLIE